MRRAAALLLLAAGCAAPARRDAPGTPVADLYDAYLAARAALDPNWATEAGIHDHDARLTRFDDATRTATLRLAGENLARLQALDPERLSTDERLDARLWTAQLETELYEAKRIDERTVRPDLPLGAVSAVHTLLVKDFAPLERRKRDAASRLRQLPDVIGDVRPRLAAPPRIWTEMAIEDAKGAAEAVGGLAKDAGDAEAGERARRALEDYVAFLERDLLPRSTGGFAVGRAAYDFYLQRYHLLDLDADRLLEIGRREWDRSIALLEDCAKSIDPKRPWTEILAGMLKEHPPADRLLEHYRGVVARARKAMDGIVTLPAGESLQVVETPAFERSAIPYAAYHAPGPLDSSRVGHFYVTPVDPAATPEEREAQLAGHNVYDIPGTVWHEAYPGHHTQFVAAKDVKSKVRALNSSPLLSEGWGFYCEELAHEAGFFADPRERLMQLNWRLQRAARILLDASLHAGGMGVEEAVAFLRDRVRMEEPQARGSVRGYTRSPAYFMAYMVGMLELRRIREAARARLGPRFSLREFHDRVLRYGNVPPGLIERELERDWR